MSRIALLVPHFKSGDAVGHDMAQMGRILLAEGYECEYFCAKNDSGLVAKTPEYLKSFLRGKTDILIYHYSIAWDFALRFFRETNCIKIIKYHNVTPPEFFDPYHKGIANACREGRRALGDFLNAGCDRFIGDSLYNNRDASAFNFPAEQCSILPPFHAIEELRVMPADLSFLKKMRRQSLRDRQGDESGGTVFLMVGRIVPNKGYESLLRAFAFFRRVHDPAARLILVGSRDPSLRRYNQELKQLGYGLGIAKSVSFLGSVTPARLKSCYLSADIFVIFSEHEGFCVPLVEAMALGLPVIALGRAAVPETAGNAALILDTPDPETFADVAINLRLNIKSQNKLREAGYRRYRQEFANEVIATKFTEILRPFISRRTNVSPLS